MKGGRLSRVVAGLPGSELLWPRFKVREFIPGSPIPCMYLEPQDRLPCIIIHLCFCSSPPLWTGSSVWVGTVSHLLCLLRAWLIASFRQMLVEWMKGPWADLQGYRIVCVCERGSRQGRVMMRKVPASGLLCMLVWGRVWHWDSGTDSREPCPRPASKLSPSRRGGWSWSSLWRCEPCRASRQL